MKTTERKSPEQPAQTATLPKVAESAVVHTGLFPERIERSDIQPRVPKLGGTEIVFQRHGAYVRDKDDPNVGSLYPEAVEEVEQLSQAFFETLIGDLPEEERSGLDILVVASDTQYYEGGRRSLETAEHVLVGAHKALAAYNLGSGQLLNQQGRLKGGEGPRPMAVLREPNIFTQSPDFVEFLRGKYGEGQPFWAAFESDAEKEVREAMGAEGPHEIADRLDRTVHVLARYGRAYHQANPGRRLVIWAATHYDTISPYTKKFIFKVPTEEQTLMVDYGGGISLNINPDGSASTVIAGKEYPVPLRQSGAAHPADT